MIKTIQLLKESFVTYKINFKKIFTMAWPIVLLTIVAQYYAFGIQENMENGQFEGTHFFIAFLIYFVSIISVSLFFIPAFNRSIQKNEDNGVFSVKEGYNFQKKNIWKFVMVNIWGLLYIVKRLALYIIVAVLLLGAVYVLNEFYTLTQNYIISLTLVYLAGITIFVGIILNMTRFVLYKNIFFSKDDISARDAVKESIVLGVTKMNDIWKIIIAMIIVSIPVEILIMSINKYLINMLTDIYLIEIIFISLITTLFSLPYVLIVLSKGYVKVRGMDVPLPIEEDSK